MDLYKLIEEYVAVTVAKFKAANADGKVTFPEAFELLTDCIKRLVDAAHTLDVTGPEKKQAVLAGVGTFYDVVIEPLDIPYLPDPVFDPIFKRVVLEVASGMIESFVKLGK